MLSFISNFFNTDISFIYTQDDYNFDVSSFNMFEAECPCCGALGFFTDHATYTRYFSNTIGVLTIKRVRCTKCKHTHALLPEIIIPYRYFSSPFILKLFTLYLKNSLSISKIETVLNVSRQFIEKLIDFFKKYHEQLLYMTNPYLKNELDHMFQRDYFMRNHFFFMQTPHHKNHHNLHMEIFT